MFLSQVYMKHFMTIEYANTYKLNEKDIIFIIVRHSYQVLRELQIILVFTLSHNKYLYTVYCCVNRLMLLIIHELISLNYTSICVIDL